MEFSDLIKSRHSIRSYAGTPVAPELLEKIIAAAELAPSSRNKKPCSFITVTDWETLARLSEAKAAGSQMLKDAAAAIIVAADSGKSDVWIEDASIAMTYLHLAASDLGLGSCWIQIRNRNAKDGSDSAEFVKSLFQIKGDMQVLAILSIGNKVQA